MEKTNYVPFVSEVETFNATMGIKRITNNSRL